MYRMSAHTSENNRSARKTTGGLSWPLKASERIKIYQVSACRLTIRLLVLF